LLLSSAVLLHGQTSNSPDNSPPPADKPPVELEKFVVTDRLDRAREDIVPSLGATSYELTAIQISARRLDDSVAIEVENAFDPETPAPARMGMGLAHVRERLRAVFGEKGELDAGAQAGVYRVSLRFPCASPMAASRRA